MNNIDSKFYSKKYLDNELNDYYYKSNIDNKISNLYDNYYDKNNINLKFNELYNKNYLDNKFDNIYDKNYINNLSNNLYSRSHLDNKFNNIYNKTQVNDIKSKLNKDILLFNTNLTNHINKHATDKKQLEDNIKDNKSNLDEFIINTFSVFSNNISNLNNSQNYRLTALEDDDSSLTDIQLNKVKQLETIDLN